ncbi:hypothetical protein [Listeria rocourtiae]|uniref:hypothetical protein n=1 Tax=Listeria rocourtiae TaxID=647910 RepID=UPI003D2F99FE
MKRILDINIAHEKALEEDYKRNRALVLDELKRLYTSYSSQLGAYEIIEEFEYTHMRLNMHRKEKLAKAWWNVETDDILRKFMSWIDEVSE